MAKEKNAQCLVDKRPKKCLKKKSKFERNLFDLLN